MRVFFDRWGTGDAAHVFAGFIGRPYVAVLGEGDAVADVVSLELQEGFLVRKYERQ